MNRTKNTLLFALLTIALLTSACASTSNPGGTSNVDGSTIKENLERCLLQSATQEDKNVLARYIYAGMSKHPLVKNLSDISPDELDNINKDTAQVLETLLIEKCKNETKTVFESKNEEALVQAMEKLGESAGLELVSHPDVENSFTDIDKYFDYNKWVDMFREEK